MIALSFVMGVIGGSTLFVFHYYGHSEETLKELEETLKELEEIWLKYNVFYSLWTFVCCLIIIIGNSSILYSIKIRVRNLKTNFSSFRF